MRKVIISLLWFLAKFSVSNLPLEWIASGIEISSAVISGYDQFINKAPQSTLLQSTTDRAERAVTKFFRFERAATIPGVETFGNLVSIHINLNPTIEPYYVEIEE
jgi:hypothetical protein